MQREKMKDFTQRTKPEASILRHMTETAEKLVERRKHQMGYPFDQETNLKEFYEWLLETGLCTTTLISVGSPYKDAWDMLHVDEFERASVDWIAKTFGFPENTHWGVVTNGGTDGNMHGIYFGRKELAAQSDIPPVLYVSEEAHYSVQKLGDILNIETRVIHAYPEGGMNLEDFRRQLDPARPALVAVAIGGTFKGAIDDQAGIDRILKEVRPPAVYRHLDVALFGGYLPWLEDPEARDVVDQAKMGFDSLAVSGHKFLH
jgi:Glutamate decarboxylase and related PLP-dependent proteins